MNALGIDLGGTQIKCVVVSESGELLRRELRATNDDGTDRFAEAVRALTDELGRDLPLGLSAPGLARADGRAIASMPGRMHGLEDLDWTTFLGREWIVPVMNDAHASLIGEAWTGAARGFRDVIMVTLGTGVGGAIISEGRLLRGNIGRGGHLGHTCLDVDGPPDDTGMRGSLEVFCGNLNIGERTGGRFATTHDLVAAYRAGDADAAKCWLRSVRALACAIASFTNVLDCEAAIIGGGIAQAGDALFTPLTDEIAKVEWRPLGHAVKLLPAQLGEWAGAIGAARSALDRGAVAVQFARMINQAVILAAGRGTRMKDLTDELPKPMLAVRGRPILEHIIEGLRDAGIQRVLLVVGYREDVVRGHFGDGASHGVAIEYVTQVVQDDRRVVELAKPFVGAEPFVLSYGDILIHPENYRRLVALGDAEAFISVKHNPGEIAKGGAIFVDDNFTVTDVREKPGPGEPVSPWYNAGVYSFRPSIFSFTATIEKSPRGEYELTDAIRAQAQASGKVRALELSGDWADVRDPQVLAELNR